MVGLQKENSSLLMHSLNDFLPAFNLLLVPKAALPRESVSSLGDGCALGEKQAGSSSLRVVFGKQIGWDSVRLASDSRKGTEDDSILELYFAELDDVGPGFAHDSQKIIFSD